MLTKNIHPLKLAMALFELHHADSDNPRLSLLDFIILLTIFEHPENGKSGLCEIINGRATSKSFLDRAIDRLIRYDLIDRAVHEGVSTLQGEARVTYTVSKNGKALLKQCAG